MIAQNPTSALPSLLPLLSTINSAFTNELANLATQLQQCTVQVKDSYGGSGSGVIWNIDGLVITNAHVMRSYRATVTLANNRVCDAIAIARDPQLDLAALRLDRQDVGDLPHAIAANSDCLRVGELVIAVGNPLGMVGALNTGIVTWVPYPSNFVNARSKFKCQFRDRPWIVSDVQLAPGNSGGLLADARGRAIGINTMIVNGLALAIPSNTVETFLHNSLARPYFDVR
jgi:serine protease Do